MTLFGVSESAWSWFQKDMGSWSDVIPEIVLSPDQAQLYKEKIGIWPPSKWVLPFNEDDGIENDDGLSRAFRSDITKWQFEKNSNGEWIIPIWQDETFVEHILTPRPVLFSRIFCEIFEHFLNNTIKVSHGLKWIGSTMN